MTLDPVELDLGLIPRRLGVIHGGLGLGVVQGVGFRWWAQQAERDRLGNPDDQQRSARVRGLGERYTTSALNGARVPSPEPERRVVDPYHLANINGEWFLFAYDHGRKDVRTFAPARILDVKYHTLLPTVDDVGGAVDYYQWGSLLRSVGAFESYRKIYRDAITPYRVAELLILRLDMPRSLHASLNEVMANLQLVSSDASSDTLRHAGKLRAELAYGRIDEILATGLHAYLTQFLDRVNELGARISRDFLVPVPV